MNYLELGYNRFGIKTIATFIKDTPWETRNSSQPGALVADGVYAGSGNDVFKIDKDGAYAGNAKFSSAQFSVNVAGNAKLSYISNIPSTVVNGYVWMESDGLHIYYGGTERTVQVV